MVLSKGVLQVLSCSVYIDNLLAKLANCGVGCYIGSVFVAALAYADDIVLLASPPSVLHKMLHMCELFASAYDIKFNVDKSKCKIVPPRGRHSVFVTQRSVMRRPGFSFQ